MRNKYSQTLVVLILLLALGVGGRFHDSVKEHPENEELFGSEPEEVTFSREKRERPLTKDPNIVLCFYCEHTMAKKNYACADPIDETYLVLVQCNGTCVKIAWMTKDRVPQFNRTCRVNTPCFSERSTDFLHYCCRKDECNGTDTSRRSLIAITATVVFQVVRAFRRFYVGFS